MKFVVLFSGFCPMMFHKKNVNITVQYMNYTITLSLSISTETGVNLDCTNDYEYRMSCHFDAPNCTDYNVTLWSLDGYG